jgi:formyl-CoA transferase
MQNVAPRLSQNPGRVATAGPALGQHNDEVFSGRLGLNPAEIAELAARRIIGTGAPEAA